MCRIIGILGRVIWPSCTLVVSSQTNTLAWNCAEATNIKRPSRLMQKEDTSGLTPSNLLFSGLRKLCFILACSDSSLLSPASTFSSRKTIRLEAEQTIRSRQSTLMLFLRSQLLLPITYQSSSWHAGSSYSSLSMPCEISGSCRRAFQTSLTLFSKLIFVGTSANGSPRSYCTALKSSSQCISSYSTFHWITH